ncbi:DUF1161 domain-containing protein [Aquimonas sp.]|jgi:hypothetical protein|uniref:DUF1161 domain-containing protein n=1 Tax=Aquimonas sp. TaxID=1872588 RepID=UPI0037BEBF67
MKRSLMIAVLSLLLTAHSADAVEASAPSGHKDCEELKQEIAARIEANGVRQYQLQIVEPEAEQVGRIVGSCNGGSRRIAYQRGLAEADTEAAAVVVAPLETIAQNAL